MRLSTSSIKSTIAVLLVILLTATSSAATTVERLTLDTLVKKASSIVVGTVRSSRTFWSDNRRLILTTYNIEVAETMKGQPSRIVELTTIGGTVGDVTLHVAGMPTFAKGESAVVFIEKSGAFSTVVGLGQGKFAVNNGEVSNSMTGLEFPDGATGRPVKMPIESFKSRIQLILDSQH
jgi:hypothetical protein